jgi:hypothetical protein
MRKESTKTLSNRHYVVSLQDDNKNYQKEINKLRKEDSEESMRKVNIIRKKIIDNLNKIDNISTNKPVNGETTYIDSVKIDPRFYIVEETYEH